MKKYVLLVFVAFAVQVAGAQSRGIKVAYINMDYILDKVPDYAEAKNMLEQKAQKWKQEIEVKKNDIIKLKESLKAEKALLTKELIEEREEEITFLETELLDFQEKKFGPKGELMSQKAVLVKPIQDQVFTIVQDLSTQRNYDFVFDKSSDLTMLFAAQRHDISDHVVRRLTRAGKREQMSGKEIKKLEAQEAQEDLAEDPEYAERLKKQEDKKAERQRLLDERKAARDERMKAAADKREQAKQDRDSKRTNTTTPATNRPATNKPATTNNTDTQDNNNIDSEDDAPADNTTNRPASTTTATDTNTADDQPVQGENGKEVKTTATDTPEEGKPETVQKQNAAQEAAADRARKQEERRQAIEARKQKILADREAAKKAREGQQQNNTNQEENDN